NSGVRIPIIAMTAHAMKGDKERCLDSGMDAYVAKPVSRKDVEEALQIFFPQMAPSPDTNVAPTPVPKTIWDRAKTLERLDGDENLLREVIHISQRKRQTCSRNCTAVWPTGTQKPWREPHTA
ncbi:MAG: hypothetical protein ACM34E_06915, partial [Acidobacteriota bacterium]